MAINLVIPNTFVAHTAATAAAQNQNISAIETYLNATGVGRYQAGSINTAAIADGQITTALLGTDSVTNDKLNLTASTDATVTAVLNLTTSYADSLSLTGQTPGTYLIVVNAYADDATSVGTTVATRLNIDSGGATPILCEEADANEFCGGMYVGAVNSTIAFQAKRVGGGTGAVAINPGRLHAVRIA